MKKTCILFVFVFLLNFVFASNALAARDVLSVPKVDQQYNGWCWAASDKSIIHYCKGSSPSLQTIVDYIPDGDKGANIKDVNKALNHWGVETSLKYEKLTYTGVQSQINNNHPIYAKLSNAGGLLGHANVIRGYDTSTNFVLFMDPIDGAYHGQSYSNYCDGVHWDGNYWEWTRSIFDCQ